MWLDEQRLCVMWLDNSPITLITKGAVYKTNGDENDYVVMLDNDKNNDNDDVDDDESDYGNEGYDNDDEDYGGDDDDDNNGGDDDGDGDENHDDYDENNDNDYDTADYGDCHGDW